MKNQADRNIVFVTVLALLVVTACSTQSRFPRSHPPLPPSMPLPATAFTVRFVAAGNQKYPPTKETERRAYRVVWHIGNGPEEIRRNEKPTRPYTIIGKLYFGENWYTDKNLDELRSKYVSEVGGDAILTWEVFQTSAAALFEGVNLYYATYEAEVIRYTDG